MAEAKPALADPAGFVRANTRLRAPRLVPEIVLWQADAALPLWRATEPDLAAAGAPPPYWAFAWAGGQALARFVLDRPAIVAGRTVLDFAAGSGLCAIAAAKAGARRVVAAEIDPLARVAISLNAAANGACVEIEPGDLVGGAGQGWDVILAGDVFYEQPMAARVEAWLGALAAGGTQVLIGDPGRTYFPRRGVERLARYDVPTTTEIEDSDLRATGVWRFAGPAPSGRRAARG
jgi:predicted nicotinamide N-methyase